MPCITLLLGDRNGIGPEIVAKFLSEPVNYSDCDVEVFGDPQVLEEGVQVAGVKLNESGFRITPFRPDEALETTRGKETAGSGSEVLELLVRSAKRVMENESDGVVFAPLNKAAMHLGGLRQEDEMQFLAQELSYDGPYGELNVLDKIDSLWTTRVTSHVPLVEVGKYITRDAVLQSIRFADQSLRAAGFAAPRVGVAALNPHAGDGGNFGREEIDIIDPAVAVARADGIDVEGALPSDTIFVRARNKQFDVVVTMYHDQGQIAMKLMGFGRGVTVLGGLPVAITTCGHGTGYDIAGQGVATPEAFKNAFVICRQMALSRVAERR